MYKCFHTFLPSGGCSYIAIELTACKSAPPKHIYAHEDILVSLSCRLRSLQRSSCLSNVSI